MIFDIICMATEKEINIKMGLLISESLNYLQILYSFMHLILNRYLKDFICNISSLSII